MSFIMHIMKILMKAVFLGIFFFLLTSCFYRKPIELVVYDKKVILSNSPIKVESVRPFFSIRKINYIGLYLDEAWSLAKSENTGEIELKNTQKAIVEIILIDESGNKYTPGNYGNAGGKLAAYFAISEDIKITSVEIKSSLKLKCNRIVWYCFDPM